MNQEIKLNKLSGIFWGFLLSLISIPVFVILFGAFILPESLGTGTNLVVSGQFFVMVPLILLYYLRTSEKKIIAQTMYWIGWLILGASLPFNFALFGATFLFTENIYLFFLLILSTIPSLLITFFLFKYIEKTIIGLPLKIIKTGIKKRTPWNVILYWYFLVVILLPIQISILSFFKIPNTLLMAFFSILSMGAITLFFLAIMNLKIGGVKMSFINDFVIFTTIGLFLLKFASSAIFYEPLKEYLTAFSLIVYPLATLFFIPIFSKNDNL